MTVSAIQKRSSPARAGIMAAVAATVVLLAYAWTAYTVNPVIATREPGAYYGFLTDAFLSGQTYLKAKPDPRLTILADPYLGAQGVPRLHDATYFRGRYYLYFGAAPVFFLYGPWRLLTGTFLTDGAGTAIFAMAGFLAGCALLWNVWRRWFNHLSVGWLAGAIFVWGFGNYTFILVEASSVYPVAITCAYALIMTALLALWQSLRSASLGRVLIWLGLGSFLWACTIAARPNYIFSLPALGIPPLALILARDGPVGSTVRRRLLLLLVAAVPVLSVGAALAVYNWVRFQNIFEFGVTYMFAGSDQRHLRLLEAGRLFGNLRYFLLGFLQYSPYFPFLPSGEGSFSLISCAPLGVLALFFPVSLWAGSLRRDRLWVATGSTLLTVFCLNLVSLGISFANERYVLDFAPAAILLGLIVGFSLLSWSRRAAFTSRWLTWVARILLATLAGLTLVQNGVFALSRYPNQRRLAPLARKVDLLVSQAEHLLNIEYGPLNLRVTFHPQPGGVEPLVVSGSGRDVLFVFYPTANEIQIGFHHAGAGGPTSEPTPIEPGRPYHMVIDLGALYPPRDHPVFASWTDTQFEVLHRVVSVRIDGTEVLGGASAFYPTDPWHLEIGRNSGGLITGPRFSGQLVRFGPRHVPSRANLRKYAVNGPLRLTLIIPPFTVYKTEPLISTGHAGAGDLLFLTYLGPGRIRFGHDSWNGGAVVSPPVEYTAGQPCALEVDMGSLRHLEGTHPIYAQLLLRFNGQLLMQDRRPFYPTTGQEITFGFNGMGSTAAEQIYSGHIHKIENIPSLAPPPGVGSTAGPLHLVARFPTSATGTSEPLVVTGQTGAGDLIYVTYLDATHIRIGYDHWNVGGPHDVPVPIDYSSPHDIEVFLGSLLPPVADAWWAATPPEERARLRRLVLVTVDGATALEHASDTYPATPDQVYVGTNPIGGSTCQPVFNGQVFVAERRGPDVFTPMVSSPPADQTPAHLPPATRP